MNILVTGGGGFLGQYICRDLVAAGHSVTSLSRCHHKLLDSFNIKTMVCDLSNELEVQTLVLDGFDAVIHTAAKAGVWGRPEDFYKINFIGTKNLLAKVTESGIKYFIYTSSPSVVFGNQDIIDGDESIQYPQRFYTEYAKTKAMAESMVLNANNDAFKTIAIRPHLIWGPGDPHLIPRLIERAKAGKLKQVGTGNNLVDITYVENASMAHIQALSALSTNRCSGGNAYFIGQEKPVYLWSFIKEILRQNNIADSLPRVNFKLAYLLGFLCEFFFTVLKKYRKDPPMTRFVAMQLAKNHYFSHDLAQEHFGYNPVFSTAKGLEKLSIK